MLQTDALAAVARVVSPQNRLAALRAAGGSSVVRSKPLAFYGNNAHFHTIATHKILSGPADTGKTMTSLYQFNEWAWQYPRSQWAIVRKTYKSIPGSVMQTFFNKILPYPPSDPRCPVQVYGGEKRPEIIIYPNGSQIWIGGMDNPDKVLSSERDGIYVNQAEELTGGEWEVLTTRANGRAGNAPFAVVMGDCNPGNQFHWILEKARSGALAMVESRHKDNPEIYNQETGEITEGGRQRIATLDALTGLRYKRLRLGLWVAAEGQVYEFDPEIHVIKPGDVPGFVRRYRSIDFGYTNPFVCQWWGEDNDGRLYLYREIYMTKRTVRVHAEQINRLSQGETYEATIADHDAEDRATLEEHGIYTIAAKKEVTVGIEKVQERLKIQADGRPRLYVVSDALVELDQTLKDAYKPTCTLEEFPGYVYPTARQGKNADEKPVKEDDHGMDDTRYMIAHIDMGLASPASETIEFNPSVFLTRRGK